MTRNKVSIHYYTADSITVEDIWATAARFSTSTLDTTEYADINDGESQGTKVVVNRAMSTATTSDGEEGPRYRVNPDIPLEGIHILHADKDAYTYADTLATTFNEYFKPTDNSVGESANLQAVRNELLTYALTNFFEADTDVIEEIVG